MAFKPVVDLDAENSISIGGKDKKTGKPNPNSAEGYYLGSKTTESKFGPSKLHILQTPKGNIGVWGKTDMDRKLGGVIAGTMVRVTYAGEVPSNKGNPMKKFKVEVDDANRINVDGLLQAQEEATDSYQGPEAYDDGSQDDMGDSSLDADSQAPDEITTPRPQAPRAPTRTPSPDQQKRVQDLLNRNKRAS